MQTRINPGLENPVIGVLGAGQLGAMTIDAAHQLGLTSIVWGAEDNDPAMRMATHRIIAPFDDPDALEEFARIADVATAERENVPLLLAKKLAARNVPVRPGETVLHVAQSRQREKNLAHALNFPTTPTAFLPVGTKVREGDWKELLPGILKIDGLGYDGRGQRSVNSVKELETAFAELGVACVLEKRVAFSAEYSILVARSPGGEIAISDMVQNTHRDGILDTTVFNHTNEALLIKAQDFGWRAAKLLGLEGVIVFEFFVDEEGNLLFNEMAPRPHNSFHGSIEAAYTSQFEQLVRAICNWRLGDVYFHTAFTMENLIGGSWEEWSQHLRQEHARLHLYGKDESRPDRKMGHVTRLDVSQRFKPL